MISMVVVNSKWPDSAERDEFCARHSACVRSDPLGSDLILSPEFECCLSSLPATTTSEPLLLLLLHRSGRTWEPTVVGGGAQR